MNEKQILKEIAFYSKLIDSHKKRSEYQNNGFTYKPYNSNMSYTTKNNYSNMCNTSSYTTNKYKYIKKTESSVILPVQEKTSMKQTSSKVLINPNFKGSVHINPHFNANKMKINTQNIYVNPKIINIAPTQNIKSIKISITETPVKQNITVTPHKIIKTVSSTLVKMSPNILSKTPVRKRRISIRTKYKIVKSNAPKSISSQSKTIIKNKFKIDRRSKSLLIKSLNKKKLIRKTPNENLRTTLFKNKTWRKSALKLNNIIKKQTKIKMPENKMKRTLISLRGQKYVLDSTKKTLRLIRNNKILNNPVKKINIKGVMYIQKSMYTYVKSTANVSNMRSRRTSVKSTPGKQFRTNNIPCPVYHRFGKCRRKDAGRCMFKHNPDQVALCKKFLQGDCIADNCLLSHKVSLEKMPTCKYYLEGCCIRSDCPYLHVKISPNADICRSFLEGFCKEAGKCEKRHQYLCPDFERNGNCPRRRCRYPHKSKCLKEKSKIPKSENTENKITENINKVDVAEQVEIGRYYLDKKEKNANTEKVSDKNNENENNDEIYKRIKLGDLPSFIPLD